MNDETDCRIAPATPGLLTIWWRLDYRQPRGIGGGEGVLVGLETPLSVVVLSPR